MVKNNKRSKEVISTGSNWARMPIGFCSRLVTFFEELPKKEKPPKHTATLLALLCEYTQRESNFIDDSNITVEVSARKLAEEITPPYTTKPINSKTVNNAINWLVANGWIAKDNGRSKSHRTTVIVNLQKIREFATPSNAQLATDIYKTQSQDWQRAIDKYHLTV